MKARMLVSYHYFRDADFDQLIRDAACRELPDLWADSGAFSAMTLGAKLSLEGYADWLARWRHLFSAACTLDVIGDPVGTMRNLEALEALGADVLPVYHMRADRWDIFDAICDGYAHACLGGMAGTGTPPMLQLRFLVHAMRRARDRGCATVFHTLGMTSNRVLNNVPIYSSDCSTWASTRRWGYYNVFDAAHGTMRQIRVRNPADLSRWARLLREHGMTDVRRLLDLEPPLPLSDALATVASLKRERWIRDRIGPVPRPDRPDDEPGLRLYMCLSNYDDYDQFGTIMRGADHVDDVGQVSSLASLTDLPWRDRPGKPKERV